MKKKKAKQSELKIIYAEAEDISSEEAQRRVDAAFDILFEEVLKHRH